MSLCCWNDTRGTWDGPAEVCEEARNGSCSQRRRLKSQMVHCGLAFNILPDGIGIGSLAGVPAD